MTFFFLCAILFTGLNNPPSSQKEVKRGNDASPAFRPGFCQGASRKGATSRGRVGSRSCVSRGARRAAGALLPYLRVLSEGRRCGRQRRPPAVVAARLPGGSPPLWRMGTSWVLRGPVTKNLSHPTRREMPRSWALPPLGIPMGDISVPKKKERRGAYDCIPPDS